MRPTADRGEFDEELARARLGDGTVNLDQTVADFLENKGSLRHDAGEVCLFGSNVVSWPQHDADGIYTLLLRK